MTESRDIAIFGAGGFAQEVLWTISDLNKAGSVWNVIGFMDERPEKWSETYQGYPIFDPWKPLPAGCVVALGVSDGELKRRIMEGYAARGVEIATLIHPSAILGIDPDRIGAGTIIQAGAIVTNNIRIGQAVTINIGTTIGHDSVIGDYVNLSPGVHVSGNCTIGVGAMLGTGATVREKLSLGAWSIAGMNAAIVKDVPERSMVGGIPARSLRIQRGDVKVSICCLTFNQAAFIRETIQGFLMQRTRFPVEILVHDDASTDGTTEILREYERKDEIKLIVQPVNTFGMTGLYPSFNLYKIAQGRYIAECDGDDYWTDPDKLQKQADFLDRNSDYAMCHHDYLILENGKFRPPHSEPPRDFTSVELIRLSQSGHGIGCCTRMMRNCLTDDTADDIALMVGDYSMNVYMGTMGKCKYIPGIAPSVYRRKHGGNSWCSLPPAEIDRKTKEMHLRIYRWMKTTGDLAHIEMRRAFL